MNEALLSLGLAYGPTILVAGLILVAGYFTGKWAPNALDARLRRDRSGRSCRYRRHRSVLRGQPQAA
jgi:hypothetical protein